LVIGCRQLILKGVSGRSRATVCFVLLDPDVNQAAVWAEVFGSPVQGLMGEIAPWEQPGPLCCGNMALGQRSIRALEDAIAIKHDDQRLAL
jgi:hypothetical protein